MTKQLAHWIYYEDGDIFYCYDCVRKRVDEINANREFSDSINYDNGDNCGFYQDYADVEHEVRCCKCKAPLFSRID